MWKQLNLLLNVVCTVHVSRVIIYQFIRHHAHETVKKYLQTYLHGKWDKRAVCWRGRAINVCVLDSIDSLKIVLFRPVELSSLTTVVVAATETCRNVAWLYKHLCRMLDEFEGNNLMDFLIFCLFLCLFVLITNREHYHCDYLTEVIYFVFGMPLF
jgi:hypothetical protein